MPDTRCRAPLDRVDLHQQNVVALDVVEQRVEGRVTRVAAVPVRLALNLNRLEDGWQASRGHDVSGGELLALKDVALAGPDVRGCDEQLDALRRAQALEVDQLVNKI